MKLESQTDAKLRSFEEARGDIGNRIGEQKLRGEREKYLDRLRAQATITWRNTELEKAYETALAKRRGAAAAALFVGRDHSMNEIRPRWRRSP